MRCLASIWFLVSPLRLIASGVLAMPVALALRSLDAARHSVPVPAQKLLSSPHIGAAVQAVQRCMMIQKKAKMYTEWDLNPRVRTHCGLNTTP